MYSIHYWSGLEEDARTDREEETKVEDSASESDHSEEEEEKEEVFHEDFQPIETQYTENHTEELGQVSGETLLKWVFSGFFVSLDKNIKKFWKWSEIQMGIQIVGLGWVQAFEPNTNVCIAQ